MLDALVKRLSVDPAAFLLLVTLIRNGTISRAEAIDMAEKLDEDGEADAAHDVRCAIVEATPDVMEITPIPMVLGSDGGNSDTD